VPDSSGNPNRITQGNYSAEILQASGVAEHFWYYIIQRKGSRAIIDLVRFDTYDQAADEARKVLARMQQAE
jgi:hypothetical protein